MAQKDEDPVYENIENLPLPDDDLLRCNTGVRLNEKSVLYAYLKRFQQKDHIEILISKVSNMIEKQETHIQSIEVQSSKY